MLTQRSNDPVPADARPATVLVVDDQANARDLLCAELTALGFEVVSAADGEEAWQRFCSQTPDVVITDMASRFELPQHHHWLSDSWWR